MSPQLPADPAQSTLYLDWVDEADPDAAPDAEKLFAAVRTGLARAYERPGRFLDDMKREARRLPAAHLPWFWDTVGHRLSGFAPKHAATAYADARDAEARHALPVDDRYRVDNALLFARAGAIGAARIREHQEWLAATYPADRAHREFARFVAAWGRGRAAPPADLHARVRRSAKAAGLGLGEDAEILAQALADARGTAVPDGLLDGAAKVFAEAPPPAGLRAALAEIFPTGAVDGSAWLRMLDAAGVVEAMADGAVRPSGGLAGWLGSFAAHYSYVRVAYGGIMPQPMPDELYAVLPRFAARLREEAVPVRLHESRYRGASLFDADLVDACLAVGVAVEDPGERVRLQFWGGGSRRDLTSLAADPVLGPRLEGTVHAGLRAGTAISRLPEAPGVEKAVHTRISVLIDRLAEGGVAAAEHAAAALEGLLDPPTVAALDGLDEALAALDLAVPLARTLRAGIPAELGWPALDDALADLGEEAAGVTSTWPVLTVYGRSRAIAIDHAGRRGECAFALPEGTVAHSVHYAGGDFLVGWSKKTSSSPASHAFWASAPGEVFEPERNFGMRAWRGPHDGVLGFQFEARGGRNDGELVLRPGGREGIGYHERQFGDGDRIWSAPTYARSLDEWTVLDTATGEQRTPDALPGFLAADPPGDDASWDLDHCSLARLPDGADGSPLGHSGGLAGFRVAEHGKDRGRPPSGWTIEGTDGRTARFRYVKDGGDPWGVLRMPGGPDLVMASVRYSAFREMRCHDASDGALLWEGRPFPGGEAEPRRDPRNRPVLPPPAFWHFLVPRDAASSAALRGTGEAAARALLAAAPGPDAVRDVLARELPQVTDPVIAAGVVDTVLRAAAVLRRRRATSRRVEIVRSGATVRPPAETPDTSLDDALLGLLPPPPRINGEERSPRPATVTAIAADGRYLDGAIDDTTRLASPPARPLDWAPLLGAIDAAAWRLVAPSTSDADRAALAALLRTWADQPFARPGTWRRGYAAGAALAGLESTVVVGVVPSADGPIDPERAYRFVQRADAPEPAGAKKTETVTVARDDAARLRRLLDLYERNGPLTPDKDAVEAFVRGTGVRRALAALVLDGLPRRAYEGGDRSDRFEAHKKMLRTKPYSATKEVAQEAEDLSHRLGVPGRQRVVAAGMPDDPAELWAGGGHAAAAARMADAWSRLLGRRAAVDEELVADLERDLGLPDTWAVALADPAASPIAAADLTCVVADQDPYGIGVHTVAPDGTVNTRRMYHDPYVPLASVLVWALTERPVGDPAVAGVRDLAARLKARLAAPGLLLPLGLCQLGDPGLRRDLFGPDVHPVRRATRDGVSAGPDGDALAYDDGLLVVDGRQRLAHVVLRPSALAGPAARARLDRLCADHGLDALRRLVDAATSRSRAVDRMVARAAATPVPPGGYEANPLLSVPGLVAEAAAETGTSEDAAVLYLQLLTLARPTDRNVRRWNGWTAARHKAAQAELVDRALVQQDKRARAGRTAFVPGEWTMLKAPELPIESAKLAAHLTTVVRDKSVRGPFVRLLPPHPLHEMFEAAWTARRPR
ncbi:hypothetical protein [Actinomadura verrucosospora]|uniref:DNA-binding protein n=1 Tax=Actinomadura verrucosospora TaxID=46165 RepID=A0A7D4A389_ACTVE|nr:hypothetical protein [Actinomadura verrucosospora]QKG21445.1 hypothetical protein ACTIVE_3083 [Actinomadura verrucosospora]